MVMKCKTLMVEIMFIVMDLQNDIRINRILVEFKEKIAQHKALKKEGKRLEKLRRKSTSTGRIGSSNKLAKAAPISETTEVSLLKEIFENTFQ